MRGNCVRLTAPGFFRQVCDSADGTADGVSRFVDVPVGSYTLSQNYTPLGFAPPNPNALAVAVGAGANAVALTSRRTDLRVTLVDGRGTRCRGACFTAGAGCYIRTLCDNATASGGANGVTLITYAPAGTVTLTQSTVPLGLDAGPRADGDGDRRAPQRC